MRAAALALLLASGAASAETPVALLREAAAMLTDAETEAERRVALGRATAAQERALALVRADLRALAQRRAPLVEALAARDGAAFAATAAMARIGRAPPIAFFAHPGGPVAAARAGMALSDAAPRLTAEAEAARAAVVALTAAEAERQRLRGLLDAALRDLRDARETLDAAALEAAAVRAGATAADIETALAAFPASPGADAPPQRGAPAPVSGAVTARSRDGRGVDVAAPAWGAARAPWPATLRFAGPVAGRGEVAILEAAPGFLMVVAGLARVDRRPGDTLLAGEAFAWVGGPPPAAEEFLIDAAAGDATIPAQTIHIEIRRDGAPDDPEAWLAFSAERTDG
jgi:septal ring factor EnvC (AmiA/AmiB activator)